jgi:type VI secretion system secreted protein Hcp
MASDYLLVIQGVNGESKAMTNAIEVDTFSWGCSNPSTFGQNSGGGAGKVSFQDISFSLSSAHKASPILMEKCATGDHIANAVLHVRKQGKTQQEFYTITLEPVIVSSYQGGGHGQGVSESFSLNFSKIKFDYKEQSNQGNTLSTVTGKWDSQTVTS